MRTIKTADSLCVQCGLCCDGSLFADVELRGETEAIEVEAMGLEVEEEDGRELLIQPCRALRGMKCGLYAHRPECCRTFECRLLKQFNNGDVNLSSAIRVVKRLRALRDDGRHGEADALADERFLNQPA